jgi:GNAT superfamily N-acetyltransferase
MTALGALDIADTHYVIDRATAADVPRIVALLADDPLGSQRETAPLEQYLGAFQRIDTDPAQHLLVVRVGQGEIVGTVQLTFIPYLVRGGSTRMQIEAVRLAPAVRGHGLGTALFTWIHDFGRRHGASLAQLNSDNSRTAAQRFYETLGYTGSHIGYKRVLRP